MRRSVIAPLLLGMMLLPTGDPAAQAHAAPHHPADADGGVGPRTGSDAGLAVQLERVRRATARFRDIEVATAEGYVRFGRQEAPLMGEHWFRRDLVTEPLDLERPSTLQYAEIGGERVLVGVAYTVYQRPGEPRPEGFAGSSDVWHVHDVPRIMRAIAADRPVLRRLVERRIARDRAGAGDGRTRLVMLHAWVWLRNPDGVFALHHRALPYLQAGLPGEWAVGADETAARGVALLAGAGCVREERTVALIAGADRDQRRAIRDACDEARQQVQRALADARTPAPLNAAASGAWRAYVSRRDARLTAEQRQRLVAMVEHGSHPH